MCVRACVRDCVRARVYVRVLSPVTRVMVPGVLALGLGLGGRWWCRLCSLIPPTNHNMWSSQFSGLEMRPDEWVGGSVGE